MKNYISAQEHWFGMYEKPEFPFYQSSKKFPIKDIKIDRPLMACSNEISPSDVLYMLMNFDKNAWMPITLNQDHYLLDGQHRLELARQMGLEYIDVIIQDTRLFQ